MKDRPAEFESEVVVAERRLDGLDRSRRSNVQLRTWEDRVEVVVANKLEEAAVKAVTAAPGDHVYRGRGITSVLRRKVRGLHRHFLDKIDADIVQLGGVGAGVHVVPAIHRE